MINFLSGFTSAIAVLWLGNQFPELLNYPELFFLVPCAFSVVSLFLTRILKNV